MIEVKLLEVAGFASALQALHLPFGKECDSTAVADVWDVRSKQEELSTHGEWHIVMSEHDKNLLKVLKNRGDEHAKVLRGVVAYLEINAPRYWWAEFDTYKIGREQLASESTMHIQGKGMSEEELVKMKSALVEGTMQKRIQMISYQTLMRIYTQRYNHRLPEWRIFCQWLLDNLPYSWLLEPRVIIKASDLDKALVESNIAKELFVDEACEWLKTFVDEYAYAIGNDVHYNTEELIDDFKRAFR